MHEMAIMETVVDIVVEQAKLADAKKVTGVKLRIGELRDIIDSLMEKCFCFMARNTVADEARLEIEKVPFVIKCNQCSCECHEHISNYASMICKNCKSSDIRMISGNEFFIEEIELI